MLSQEELDKLLEEGGEGEASQSKDTASEGEKEAQTAPEAEGESGQKPPQEEGGQEEVSWEDAFKEAADSGDEAAKKAIEEGEVTEGKGVPGGKPPGFEDFGREEAKAIEHPDLDFILDIPLDVSVELGRAKLRIKDLLQLGQGSVVELNKLAGEPAEIYVNQKLMAKGEIVVVNEKFGVRLTEIISPSDRVKSLG